MSKEFQDISITPFPLRQWNHLLTASHIATIYLHLLLSLAHSQYCWIGGLLIRVTHLLQKNINTDLPSHKLIFLPINSLKFYKAKQKSELTYLSVIFIIYAKVCRLLLACPPHPQLAIIWAERITFNLYFVVGSHLVDWTLEIICILRN